MLIYFYYARNCIGPHAPKKSDKKLQEVYFYLIFANEDKMKGYIND